MKIFEGSDVTTDELVHLDRMSFHILRNV